MSRKGVDLPKDVWKKIYSHAAESVGKEAARNMFRYSLRHGEDYNPYMAWNGPDPDYPYRLKTLENERINYQGSVQTLSRDLQKVYEREKSMRKKIEGEFSAEKTAGESQKEIQKKLLRAHKAGWKYLGKQAYKFDRNYKEVIDHCSNNDTHVPLDASDWLELYPNDPGYFEYGLGGIAPNADVNHMCRIADHKKEWSRGKLMQDLLNSQLYRELTDKSDLEYQVRNFADEAAAVTKKIERGPMYPAWGGTRLSGVGM